MRLDVSTAITSSKIAFGLTLVGLGSATFSQPTSSVEERLSALEARVAALETGSARTAAAAPGPPCQRLSLNGSSITPESALTVAVNGTTVGVFDGPAYSDLEKFMRPGPNTITLSFASPGTGASAELRCLPPGTDSGRNVVFSFRPRANRLSAQTQVIQLGR